MSQAGLSRIGTGNLPPSVVITITGNDSVPESAVANNFNLLTANATVKFLGTAGTETLDFRMSNLVLGTSLPSLTFGVANTGLGNNVLNALNSGNANVAIGSQSLAALQNGNANTALGNQSGQSISSGNTNIMVGTSSGTAYTSESNNILLANTGKAGDANVIRIGTQGSAVGQQNQCFLAGVLNTVSGRVVNTTTPGAYPYTTLITDNVILVNTSIARTINLIASPVTGTTYRIKDNTGSAGTNNITITPNAGNIDGAASYILAVNFASADIVYTGSNWAVL